MPRAAPQPRVEISVVQYDSPGRDDRSRCSPIKEWVELTDNTRRSVSLDGRTLQDEDGHTCTFDHYRIEGRATVRIHTDTPTKQPPVRSRDRSVKSAGHHAVAAVVGSPTSPLRPSVHAPQEEETWVGVGQVLGGGRGESGRSAGCTRGGAAAPVPPSVRRRHVGDVGRGEAGARTVEACGAAPRATSTPTFTPRSGSTNARRPGSPGCSIRRRTTSPSTDGWARLGRAGR
ncbi:lamin tail domain-containing protein [Streptomyces sp. ALI-76-A]|uniref:lamin tail domain-containing protein n=1 Tax=Streptomyces sp. ALI-76-A TaxID=3025736 RepID=UPI00256EF5FE|nr:lamin tail domain-containing protein [Streptomyces sp. ALI-76-A]MDL5206115.1 lamin tail domain-containing protein [Streptomyces sp. ALI-76-A]